MYIFLICTYKFLTSLFFKTLEHYLIFDIFNNNGNNKKDKNFKSGNFFSPNLVYSTYKSGKKTQLE